MVDNLNLGIMNVTNNEGILHKEIYVKQVIFFI